MYSKELIARFWSKVNKKGPYPSKQACKIHPEIKGTRCWEWAGGTRKGYGYFDIELSTKRIQAQTFAYELVYGKGSLKGLCGLHKCDNTACVRPTHIFKGTKKINAKDRDSKGRLKVPCLKGEECKHNILTEKQVKLIRELYSKSGCSYSDLKLRFNVSKTTISRIINRKIWTHI